MIKIKYNTQYKGSAWSIFVILMVTFALCTVTGCIDTVVKTPGSRIYRIDYGKCPACGLCIEPCPENAITEHELENSWIVIVDPDKCIGCGECVSYCDFDAFIKESRH